MYKNENHNEVLKQNHGNVKVKNMPKRTLSYPKA